MFKTGTFYVNSPIEFILKINSLSTSLSCMRSIGNGGNLVAGSPTGVGTQPIFHTTGGVLAKLFNTGILERPEKNQMPKNKPYRKFDTIFMHVGFIPMKYASALNKLMEDCMIRI